MGLKGIDCLGSHVLVGRGSKGGCSCIPEFKLIDMMSDQLVGKKNKVK